jgi:hypothetical protein
MEIAGAGDMDGKAAKVAVEPSGRERDTMELAADLKKIGLGMERLK